MRIGRGGRGGRGLRMRGVGDGIGRLRRRRGSLGGSMMSGMGGYEIVSFVLY